VECAAGRVGYIPRTPEQVPPDRRVDPLQTSLFRAA
jgi:hypothetical protein